MSTSTDTIEELATREYKYGFVTDVEAEELPPGLSEDIVRKISAKKNEPAWMLEWRLKAFRVWQTMTEPTWQNVHYKPIDYQNIIYYSAPKKKPSLKSLDIVWSPETVSKMFEIGPAAYTPGTKMPEQTIGSSDDRRALMDFLARATR